MPIQLRTRSKGQVQPERLVQLDDEMLIEDRDPGADTLDVHRSDLLSLRLGVSIEPGRRCIEQDLEREDVRGVRGHRHNCENARSEALGR